MNCKQIEIIKCLLKSDSCLRAEYISKILDISTRTVKRHIDVINEELYRKQIQIVSIRGMGYQLKGSIEEIKNLIKENNTEQINEDRIKQMILHLIDTTFITAEELAVKMNYSASTINNLTAKLKKILKKYDVQIVSKPYYGMSLEGKEINIRSLLIDYGFTIKENTLFVDILNITVKEYECIYTIVMQYLKAHTIVIADRDIYNLLERITVSVARSKQKQSNFSLPVQKKKKNFDIVFEILNEIAQVIQIKFSDYEYDYVSIYSGFIIYNFDNSNVNIEKEVHDFLLPLLEEISIVSGVDFTAYEHIINSLSTHLTIMLTRASQNVKLKNPLLKQVKSEYAIEMNYAIFLAKKIEETFKIKVSEDELGYLAMYFGAVRNQNTFKKRVVILCHYGVGTAQLIAERIRREINELEIVGVYPIHYLELAEAQDIDLIISTVPIEAKGKKEIIFMDNFLENDCLNKLKKVIFEDENHLSKLISLFHKDAWIHLNVQSDSMAIKKLAEIMIQKGFINEKIKQSILERETISSTDIGNLVAIPHTIFSEQFKSVIGVGILKNPIWWNKERVQLVFMICINSNDKSSSSAFRHLYKIIKNINTVNQLIDCTNYENFIVWMKGDRK